MKKNESTDAVLVRQYVHGDEQALAQLIDRHQVKIYSFIFSKVRDRDLTEDIFQDTFIKVIHTLKKGKYNEEGKFVSWVVRIAHNLIIDYYRKSNKMQMQRENEEFSIFRYMEDNSPSVEDALAQLQAKKEICGLLELLPDDQQEVVKLRIFEDLSFKEIAEQTGVSINTALGRMRYAVLNMRKILEQKTIITE
ncbi:RNA polymerase sigma factor [Avrilella dinanensis]|uniref:RNA polymerase subunit sigma-24 n=1 Tax=Avrilella dinanensis TaxID=2008672 RepID=A0A2M9R3U6_9FLAO|nr:sigma-70 family RNA polymerase sigma factor [Avrilella dinanensis]PJR03529.1 RNA polymerase subunit sigma-24 [Avrilella dinanensis]